MSLTKSFELASEYVKKSTFKVSNEDKLLLYAYYKQANSGNCDTNRPSALDPVARAKWDWWNKLKGMDTQTAKLSYIKLVEKLSGKMFYGETPKPLFELNI